MFTPTGTMANVLAVGVHCAHGEEVITGSASHLFNYEAGRVSTLLGVPLHPILNQDDGTLALPDVAARRHALRLRAPGGHRADAEPVRRARAATGPPAYLGQLSRFCRQYNLQLHMDGARWPPRSTR